MTHKCVNKLARMVSDNGLSPGRRQVIIWANARILLIGPLGTNFSEILVEICTFSVKKMHFKMSSGKWLSFSLGLNVLITMVSSSAVTIHVTPQGNYTAMLTSYCQQHVNRHIKDLKFVIVINSRQWRYHLKLQYLWYFGNSNRNIVVYVYVKNNYNEW